MGKEIRKIYRVIKNGDTVEALCHRLNMDQVTLFGIIEELQLEGFDIDIELKNGQMVVYKKVIYRKEREIKEELSDLEKISFAVLGDTHMGHKKQQLQLVNSFYTKAYDLGYSTFFHLGDLTDGHYVNKRAEHPYECFAQGYDEQLDNVVNTYPFINGVNTYLISGNHDFTFFREIGANICQRFAQLRPDVEYLGMDKATVMVGKNKDIPVKLQHPDKGSTDITSTRLQKSIEKLPTGSKAKILLQGHYHRYYHMFDRNVEGFLCPGFIAGSIFIDKCELANEIGGILVDLYAKGREIQYIEYNPILYGKDEVDLESYKKIKKLVIK